MSKSNLLFIFLSVIFLNCQSCKEKSEGLITIDISKEYSKKKIKITNTEYIPLETKEGISVSSSAVLHYVSEKYILLIDRTNGDVFVFNRNGKMVTLLNKKGRGPMEYLTISNVVFDENSEEIFVFDRASTRQIQVYSLSGDCKRTMVYSDKFELMGYNFDEKTLLVYDTKGLHLEGNYSKKPYMLMSKDVVDSFSDLNINLSERYSDGVYSQVKTPSGQVLITNKSIPIFSRIHFGQDFIISDISSDTIYQLTKSKDLKPILVHTPSVNSTNPRLVCTCVLNTDKFMILHVTTLDYDAIKKNNVPLIKTLMYEYTTGKISRVDYHGTNVTILQKNTDASMISALTLKDAYDNKELSGELEKIAATLSESSNPVVEINFY